MRIHLLVLLAWSAVILQTGAVPNENSTSSEEQFVVYQASKGPGQGKHIVLVSGDEEYRSEETLTQLGKILSRHHGFTCTVLFPIDPRSGLIDPNYLNNIPGLEALKHADLMIIFIRFRNLPDNQMQLINDYINSGRPVLGMRTATHAFKLPPDRTNWLHFDYRYNGPTNWVHYDPKYSGGRTPWNRGFGGLILGDTWYYHYGHHNNQSTRGLIAVAAKNNPILRGIRDGDIWGPTDVYAVRLPLAGDSLPLVMGQSINRKNPRDDKDVFLGMRPTDDEVASTGNNPTADRGADLYNPNEPMMPIAWTRTYQVPGGKKGKVFATTMGASPDLLSEGVRRMLVNAVYWCVGLEKKIPREGTAVDLVGEYKPTPFHFQTNDYWKKKALKPASFRIE